jgi:hypothetical protein
MSTWRSRKRGSDTSLAPSNRFGIESSWQDPEKVHQQLLALCWLLGLANAIFNCFAICRAWRRGLSSYFVALLSVSASSKRSLSFYSQAIQWPPNPYLTPSEVHLLLPGLDLGAFKPSRVRYASEASIKARSFLRLLLRKPATVPSCSHTINHYLCRHRVPL